MARIPILQARSSRPDEDAGKRPRSPVIVASVCGTDEDPQGLERQEAALRDAGCASRPKATPAPRAWPARSRSGALRDGARSDAARSAARSLNVGIGSFADAIAAAGGAATRLDWAPPAGGDRAVGMALARLVNHHAVEAANAKAAERYLAAQPRLEGVGVAREVLPGMGSRMILHAGPPIAWQRMCGPMRGAIVGAILFEGWADDADAAREPGRVGRGRVRALPPPWRGRPDGGNHHPLDAGVDRGERHRTATAPSAT